MRFLRCADISILGLLANLSLRLIDCTCSFSSLVFSTPVIKSSISSASLAELKNTTRLSIKFRCLFGEINVYFKCFNLLSSYIGLMVYILYSLSRSNFSIGLFIKPFFLFLSHIVPVLELLFIVIQFYLSKFIRMVLLNKLVIISF